MGTDNDRGLRRGETLYQRILGENPWILNDNLGATIWIDRYTGEFAVGEEEEEVPITLVEKLGYDDRQMGQFYSREIRKRDARLLPRNRH